MTEYKCVSCKKIKIGNPALVNGVGSFCLECKSKMGQRYSKTMQDKRDSFDGHCVYCGGLITKSDPSAEMVYGTSGYRSHISCDTKRDWVLKCIRNSDHIAKYVAKTEAKEAPIREAKRKEDEAKKANELQFIKKDNILNKSEKSYEEKIDRLERMLEKLTSALGGV